MSDSIISLSFSAEISSDAGGGGGGALDGNTDGERRAELLAARPAGEVLRGIEEALIAFTVSL